MKYSKKPILAAAVSAVIGLGMAGQAAASVYADAYTNIYDFTLAFTDPAGNPASPQVNSFNFGITNTANLNGALTGSTAACSGSPSSNTCNPGANTGLPTPGTRLDSALATLGTSARVENTMPAFEGPGLNEYAATDSVIWTAQLTLDPTTAIQQIAEAELQGGTSAGSSANIQSSTGFSFGFEATNVDTMTVSFTADFDNYVSIFDPTGAFQNSQANHKVEMILSNALTGEKVAWLPDGNLGTGCTVSNFITLTCAEAKDDENLNIVNSISTDNTTLAFIGNGEEYEVTIGGLTPGQWTFALQSETSTNLSRQQVVPEPAMLSLLGLGLAGFGAVARRRQKKLV